MTSALHKHIYKNTNTRHFITKMKKVALVVALLFVYSHQNVQNGYYWRDYFGTIPKDAYIAGRDIHGKNIYIGQGYYKDHGLKPGRITPEVREMDVPWGHHNKKSFSNKILCGDQERFYWMEATSTNLQYKLDNKQAVAGGHDDDNGYLGIGRIETSGDTKIGKVAVCWPGLSLMYYIDGPLEKDVSSYEILMYKTSPGEDSYTNARINFV